MTAEQRTAEQRYDAIIIGAGQSGALALTLARAGRRTALIEREAVGGTCINRGCTPTKTMIASAQVAYLTRRAADFGVHTGPVSVDLARVRQRARELAISFREEVQQELESDTNLDLRFGAARFTGPQSVAVQLRDGGAGTLTADLIILNTGTRPAVPPLDGLDAVSFLDSTSIMALDAVPEHLLILGGGIVALEFGQMFRRFGSRVSLVQRGPQLLEREDADVAEAIAQILREDGIEVFTGSTAQQVRSAPDGVELTLRQGDAAHRLHGSHLLVATGRTPNTDQLNLAAAGVATDEKGYVQVNDRLETSAPGIYAMGDVKGGPAFTHIAYDDARILCTNLVEDATRPSPCPSGPTGGRRLVDEHRSTQDRLLCYTVFTDPQLGRVGLTEGQARAQGRAIQVAKLPMTETARGLETGESRGFVKVIIERETGQILGAAALCREGGELMAVLQTAMLGRLPYTALRDGVFAHPTLAESVNRLFARLAEKL